MPFLRPISDRYFEDYVEGDVHHFGTIAVEADEIVAFANQFDPQTLHTDPEAAKSGPFCRSQCAAYARVPGGAQRGRLRRRPERSDQISMGRGAGATAEACCATGSGADRGTCRGWWHCFGAGSESGDGDNSNRVRNRC